MSNNAGNNDDVIITTGTIRPDGTQTYTSRTPVENPDKRTSKQKAADQEQAFLDKLGVYAAFLNENPAIAALIKRAMKDYKNGITWTDQKFQAEYSKTKFAQSRTKAEEEFDLAMGGANADTYIKKVEDAKKSLLQSAQRMGIPITDAEAEAQATKIVRSNLSQAEVDAMWATRYTEATAPPAPGEVAKGARTGTAGQIEQSIRETAYSYGLKVDEATLRRMTAEGLGQGERWSEWLTGQQDIFREQAKLMYPTAVAQLDAGKTLEDIANPYFSEAADLLGLSPEQMDLTDPKWTGFLNGEGGRILSKDEWTRVLKTDSKYGWDKSQRARTEYASLTDQLFAAFGMA